MIVMKGKLGAEGAIDLELFSRVVRIVFYTHGAAFWTEADFYEFECFTVRYYNYRGIVVPILPPFIININSYSRKGIYYQFCDIWGTVENLSQTLEFPGNSKIGYTHISN